MLCRAEGGNPRGDRHDLGSLPDRPPRPRPDERRCLLHLDREIEPIARERVKALAKVIAWAGTNDPARPCWTLVWDRARPVLRRFSAGATSSASNRSGSTTTSRGVGAGHNPLYLKHGSAA